MYEIIRKHKYFKGDKLFSDNVIKFWKTGNGTFIKFV